MAGRVRLRRQHRILLAALLTSGLLGAVAAPAGAVVGGQPARQGQFPYVANIDIAGSYGCTGTLIAPRWVITAGHCGSLTGSSTDGTVPSSLAYPVGEYSVTLGTVNTDGTGGQTFGVSQAIVDPDYSVANGSGYDVTLLELDHASRIRPMLLAAVSERGLWEPGKLMTIAGFGLTNQNASSEPATMQFTQVPITTDAYCAGAYPQSVGDQGTYDPTTEVCAGYAKGGRDACNGDSGGPLLAPLSSAYADSDGYRYVLVGATSYGDGCGQPGEPGVYARLAEGPLRSFIAQNVPSALSPGALAPARKKKAPAKRKAVARKKKPGAKHKAAARKKKGAARG
jgi:trypsin